MSRAVKALSALLLPMFFSMCIATAGGRGSEPVVIGIYGDLSSTGARDGNDALKGARLRIKEVNETGGINGRMVELRSLDVKQNPTEAVKAFTTLAQDDRACAVIGSTVLNAGLAVSPVADLVKVSLVSLSIDDRVTTPDMKPESPEAPGLLRQYAFLIQPSASQIASSMAAYAVEHFPQRRYATLYDPSNMVSVIQARAFESAIRNAGMIVALSQELPQGGTDYRAALARIRDAAAEAIFICGTVDENVAAALQAGQMTVRPVLLGNQWWSSPLLDQAGEAAENAWFSSGISADDPSLAELGPRFSAEYGELPRPAVVPGWDAAGLIIAAVRKAGSSSPQKVRDALEQMTGFKSLLGQIDMDRKTHRPLGLPVAITRISGGRYQTVEPRYVPKPLRSGSSSP